MSCQASKSLHLIGSKEFPLPSGGTVNMFAIFIIWCTTWETIKGGGRGLELRGKSKCRSAQETFRSFKQKVAMRAEAAALKNRPIEAVHSYIYATVHMPQPMCLDVLGRCAFDFGSGKAARRMLDATDEGTLSAIQSKPRKSSDFFPTKSRWERWNCGGDSNHHWFESNLLKTSTFSGIIEMTEMTSEETCWFLMVFGVIITYCTLLKR